MDLRAALLSFAAKAPSIRVLVVGDCMLDTYISGRASRISPEAPVPVVSVTGSTWRPGGAANVSANSRAMGASVVLAGVVGKDQNANNLRGQLQNIGVDTESLAEDGSRRTTTKTRVTAAGQQIVRFDEEDTGPFGAEVSLDLKGRVMSALVKADVCIVSDYAKGVVTADLCSDLMRAAAARNVPVVVDPKARDLSLYRGATVITPNSKEAAAAAGEGMELTAQLGEVALALLSKIAPSSLLITRGEDGMSLFETDGRETHLPAVVNEVADVTGAGDTVVSALAIALGCGFTLPEAARIANIAAGIAVSHAGTWAVRADELMAAAPAQ